MAEKTQEQCSCSKNDMTACTNICAHYADVGIPIRLKPYATVGNVETECCGNPVVSFRGGISTNCGCGCEIIVTQTLSIKIPITYSTIADAGETIVNCRKPQNY